MKYLIKKKPESSVFLPNYDFLGLFLNIHLSNTRYDIFILLRCFDYLSNENLKQNLTVRFVENIKIRHFRVLNDERYVEQ